MIGRRGVRRLVRRTLIVHTVDGRSLRGILVGEYADCLILTHATLLDVDQALGGEVVVLRENVSWAQDVTGMMREAVPESFQLERGERP